MKSSVSHSLPGLCCPHPGVCSQLTSPGWWFLCPDAPAGARPSQASTRSTDTLPRAMEMSPACRHRPCPHLVHSGDSTGALPFQPPRPRQTDVASPAEERAATPEPSLAKAGAARASSAHLDRCLLFSPAPVLSLQLC